MPIDVALYVKIAAFTCSLLKEDVCKKIVRGNIEAANFIAVNISLEKDKANALNRILCHLEQAYALTMDVSWFRSPNYSVANKLCDYIALCHKELGSDPFLIAQWLIDKTYHKGGYSLEDGVYRRTLGIYYDQFYSKRIEPYNEYMKERESLAEMYDGMHGDLCHLP